MRKIVGKADMRITESANQVECGASASGADQAS